MVGLGGLNAVLGVEIRITEYISESVRAVVASRELNIDTYIYVYISDYKRDKKITQRERVERDQYIVPLSALWPLP